MSVELLGVCTSLVWRGCFGVAWVPSRGVGAFSGRVCFPLAWVPWRGVGAFSTGGRTSGIV